MNKIKSVLEWKKELAGLPQFEVLAGFDEISAVMRLKDGKCFELNKMYPSLMYDCFRIFCFHKDLKTVEGEYYKDGKVVYELKSDINALCESNGMITDSHSELAKIQAMSA